MFVLDYSVVNFYNELNFSTTRFQVCSFLCVAQINGGLCLKSTNTLQIPVEKALPSSFFIGNDSKGIPHKFLFPFHCLVGYNHHLLNHFQMFRAVNRLNTFKRTFLQTGYRSSSQSNNAKVSRELRMKSGGKPSTDSAAAGAKSGSSRPSKLMVAGIVASAAVAAAYWQIKDVEGSPFVKKLYTQSGLEALM